jgi:hypothetical protein
MCQIKRLRSPNGGTTWNPPSSNFGEAKPALVLTDFGEAKEKELGRKHSTT